MKNSFATIVNGFSAFEWQLFFLKHAYSIYKVRKPTMTKLGHTTLTFVITSRFSARAKSPDNDMNVLLFL